MVSYTAVMSLALAMVAVATAAPVEIEERQIGAFNGRINFQMYFKWC